MSDRKQAGIIKSYNLVHITTGGEYKTPLVASQLFDQAECQAVIREGFAPQKVEAWIIGSMREYFDKNSQNVIDGLKARCPDIRIRMMNGAGRLRKFPAFFLLKRARRKLGKKVPVIYHCRGENAAVWGIKLRAFFPGDKVVIDVRGYWPAELLYTRGIDDPAMAKGDDLAAYNRTYAFLKDTIHNVDAVTTVSTALKNLLVKEMNAHDDTVVVPCCVNQVTSDEQRVAIRNAWGVKDDEILLVYSGTTAAYQHLEDMTIPFLKKVAGQNSKVRIAFLSSEHETIKKMLVEAKINMDKVIVKSFPQKEVAAALTACDAGILIRKPTLVNRVANPVKIAEYLAAGLPIIIEKGVGGVSDILFEQSLLKGIEITSGGSIDAAAADVNKWLSEDIKGKRPFIREYVKDVYLWSSAIQVSRKMYEQILS